MLHAFLFEVSGLAGNYTLQNRELECIKYLQETVARNKVLVGVTLACYIKKGFQFISL
jgi:GMP synthase (glutamine-hydrolysing)